MIACACKNISFRNPLYHVIAHQQSSFKFCLDMSPFSTIVAHSLFWIRFASNLSWIRVSILWLGLPFVCIMSSKSFSILQFSTLVFRFICTIAKSRDFKKIIGLIKVTSTLSSERPSLDSVLFCVRSTLESILQHIIPLFNM